MISLDQVLLLQEKVETAVARIGSLKAEVAQLKSENDALRTKCTELTNSLTAKTEFISALEANQDKIEQGILNALSRLDSLEDAVTEGTSYVPPVAEPFYGEDSESSSITKDSEVIEEPVVAEEPYADSSLSDVEAVSQEMLEESESEDESTVITVDDITSGESNSDEFSSDNFNSYENGAESFTSQGSVDSSTENSGFNAPVSNDSNAF